MPIAHLCVACHAAPSIEMEWLRIIDMEKGELCQPMNIIADRVTGPLQR